MPLVRHRDGRRIAADDGVESRTAAGDAPWRARGYRMHRASAVIGALGLIVLTAAPAHAQIASNALFDYAPASTICSRPRTLTPADPALLVRGPSGAPINAWLVLPANRTVTPTPAVLWVHWLGLKATTSHTEFESDANELAQHGIVSLLVDMPWSEPKWFDTRTPAGDYAATIAQVVALRRALDCLVRSPGVDATRIAYVGHDFGAMDGALLLAVDDRPRYAVLMTPTISFWEWYLLGDAQPADRAAYVAQMSVFDLPGWLEKGRQKATLLQFGASDDYVAQSTGIAIRNAVPDRERTFKAYRLDHALDDDTARDDRRAWLLTHLTAP
jgi:dienelactone hydrolase